jgi:hypothetical protein
LHPRIIPHSQSGDLARRLNLYLSTNLLFPINKQPFPNPWFKSATLFAGPYPPVSAQKIMHRSFSEALVTPAKPHCVLQAPPVTLDLPPTPDMRVSTITAANIQLLQQAGAWQELQPPHSAAFQHMQVTLHTSNFQFRSLQTHAGNLTHSKHPILQRSNTCR